MSLFCPQVGQNAVPTLEHIDICSNNEGCLHSPKKVEDKQNLNCKNPLDGQRLIMEISPSIPRVIEPKHSGMDFSGYAVNLFQMYAKKYNFAPVLSNSGEGPGTYFAHNKSFSPGTISNVRN